MPKVLYIIVFSLTLSGCMVIHPTANSDVYIICNKKDDTFKHMDCHDPKKEFIHFDVRF